MTAGGGLVQNRNEPSLRVIVDPARGQALTAAVPPVPARGAGRLPGLDLTLAAWASDAFSLGDFDRYAEALAADAAGAAFEIRLSGETGRLAPAARQIALRCQRLAGRRNAASSGEAFDRVLASHRRLRDLPLPSAAAVYAHALDTWQWLLRLDPEASLALQLAALFHEADGPSQPDGRNGAWMTDELLAEAGLDLATRVRVHRLIAGREAPDRALLDEADALSWFSLGSPGCRCELGADSAARRVAGALARLSPVSRAWLRGLRLRGEVARLASLGADLPSGPELAEHAVPAGHAGAPHASARRSAVREPLAAAAVGRSSAATPAVARARRRLAAGMAGAAGIAPTRVGALLARAAVLGDLAARLTDSPGAPGAGAAPALGAAKPAPAGEGAGAHLYLAIGHR
ncbi:MAG TPA: hypothetical protein VE075_07465 [Thermoanaerobaculia bacterium]|nr:hypothetical protein [Thermoanaerobaculia bacterium]